MQTIQLREKVGDDGVLHLDVPFESGAGEVEVVLVVQPVAKNGASSEFNRRLR